MGRLLRRMRRVSRRTSRRVMRRNMAVVSTTSGQAVKMSPEDAQKVEKAGGKPPEKMTDQELDSAAQKAGVTVQDADDEDVAELNK